MSRRDRDPRDDRDRRRGGREDPAPLPQRERPRPAKQRQEALNEFFVNGDGIHREVLQREICKYLGPEAYSRPSNYNGISGYIVTAVRPFTSKMLDDLVELSNSYAAENREMRKRGQDISYGESETSRRQEMRTGVEDPPYPERFPSQQSYAVPPAQPAYATGIGSAPYAPVYPSGSSYQPGPSYPATSGYQTQGHLASIRPSTTESSYTYGNEYTNSGVPYRQGPPFPSTGGYRDSRDPREDPREDPRMYSRTADPRDTRMDPRDPRLDMRDPRLDPRDLRIDPREPRLDPRDSRLDTRPDPRNVATYPYVSSPGDVSMHGAIDDPRSYDYISSVPSLQSGRGGSFTPSAVPPRGFDPRDSPQYRTEPIREERRSRR